MYNLKHIESRDNFSLQKDEALCLYSLVKMTNPKVIVEFGFFRGFSAKNFLASMANDCILYSYDPDPKSRPFVQRIKDKRFKFVFKKGEEFSPVDIKHKPIDFVLIDAEHNLRSNVRIFNKIKGFLTPNSVIAVHDTGLYYREFKSETWTVPGGYLVGKGYVHQPEERVFVNYLKFAYPAYQQIHLHSTRVGRMGLTILQKYHGLKVKHTTFVFMLKRYFFKTLRYFYDHLINPKD
jgi:hypothetical protein